MADNTKLNLGTLGDTIRDIDKGAGVKTQVVVLDLGGSGVESLASITNPIPVQVSSSVAVAVTGPLTDAQLRGTAVPVSGPLTDTQLRLAPVVVESLPFAANHDGVYGGKLAKYINILGRRTVFNSVSALQAVSAYLSNTLDDINPVVVATTYYIVSTSALDVAGSAGASKVRLTYLDAVGATQTAVLSLNGLTKVSIGAGYTAMQYMEVSEMGIVGTRVPAGAISIFSGAGAAAAEATTVEQIQAGTNRSLTARFTIPAGYAGYLENWTVACPGSQTMDTRLAAQCFASDRTSSGLIFHFQAIAFLAAASPVVFLPLGGLSIPAGAMIKVVCLPGGLAGTPRIDINFSLLLLQL